MKQNIFAAAIGIVVLLVVHAYAADASTTVATTGDTTVATTGDTTSAKTDKPAAKTDKPAAKTDKPAAKTDKPAAKTDKPAGEDSSSDIDKKVAELKARAEQIAKESKSAKEKFQGIWCDTFTPGYLIRSALAVSFWTLLLCVFAHYIKIYTPFCVSTQLMEEILLGILWFSVPLVSCLLWGPGLYTIGVFCLYTTAVAGTRVAYYAFVFPFLP